MIHHFVLYIAHGGIAVASTISERTSPARKVVAGNYLWCWLWSIINWLWCIFVRIFCLSPSSDTTSRSRWMEWHTLYYYVVFRTRPLSSEYTTSSFSSCFGPRRCFLKWSDIKNATSVRRKVRAMIGIPKREGIPKDCSKLSLGSQKDWNHSQKPESYRRENRLTWYRNSNSSSLNSILPPRHSVTLNPSSFISPVNSKLTPPRRELQAAWIFKHEVSSLIIVPKCLVFKPFPDVSVLRRR